MKQAISATIDETLVKWVEKQLKDKRTYRNKSHLIEIALEQLKEHKEDEEKA